jgi:hypothetical protein
MKQKPMDLSVAKARAAKAAEERARREEQAKHDPHPDSHSGRR